MPTVIALDVSLSMTRAVLGNSQQTYHSLAVIGINCFLNYLQENSRLEQVSLSDVLFKCFVCRQFLFTFFTWKQHIVDLQIRHFQIFTIFR
uniref:CSON001161 protein n=1 Tax=Culicoides sonorensis TaxID=179676 RepID=A0A336MTQ4_CULSO